MQSPALFIEAIASDPDNDAPRLEYADWLVRNKNPLGEFIRIQLELAKTAVVPGVDDEATDKLKQREALLLKKHGAAWLKESLPEWARQVNSGFHRGFPGVWCNAADWVKHGDSLVARFPVHRLNVRATSKSAVDLSESEALLKVRLLDLSNSPLDDASFSELVSSPMLANLTGLYVWKCGLGVGAAQAVAKSHHLGNLRRLNMEENRITAPGIAVLVAAPVLQRLTYFNVRSNEVGPAAGPYLSQATFLSNLAELNLGNNDLGPDAVEGVCQQLSSALWSLSLDGNAMQDAGAEALAAATQVKRLATLNIAFNQLTARGAKAIAAAKQFKSLAELDLGANALGPSGIQALAKSRYLSNLVELTLSNVEMGDEGALSIAQSQTLQKLRTLNLWDCEINSEGALALAASPLLESVETLCLRGNPFDRDSRQALRTRFGKRVQM
ncbi:MAG: gala protein 1 [Planctomycetaceae bacterium]|nr:gala protein 1 [Planctomycetaceae bacterium]